MAKQMGLGEWFLISPLNTTIDNIESRIGFVIASQPRGESAPDVDVKALETIAGIVIGAIVNAITKEKFLEKTVSKDYVDTIVDTMADSLIVYDTDGNIVTINSATLRLLGYETRELIGQPISKIIADTTFSSTTTEFCNSNEEKIYLVSDRKLANFQAPLASPNFF